VVDDPPETGKEGPLRMEVRARTSRDREGKELGGFDEVGSDPRRARGMTFCSREETLFGEENGVGGPRDEALTTRERSTTTERTGAWIQECGKD